jgi:hypothetical protein
MPLRHNHDEWAKSKAKKIAAFKKRKEKAKKSGKSASAKKAKPNNTLKLALGNKLVAALVTQHHMMQHEADSLFWSTTMLLRTTRKTSGTGDGQ